MNRIPIPLRGTACYLLITFLGLSFFPASKAAGSGDDEDTVWRGGVVAADHELASLAGERMLELGGNAVDAAVATGFCLSVVRPYSSGLGGGGFMVLYVKDPESGTARSIAIDFRETAPAAVGPDYFEKLDADSIATRYSGDAVGVPGMVAGLLHALDHYGTLDRATVLQPAIDAATDGFLADAHYVQAAGKVADWIERASFDKKKNRFLYRTFLAKGGVAEGDRIKNPEQAEALMLIRDGGARGFYEGPLAEGIARTVQGAGGSMTVDDLRSYEVDISNPLIGTFRERSVITMPPPSSGGIAIQQILGMLEHREVDPATLDPMSSAYVHTVVEAMKHAFADRAEWLGDDRFVDVPIERLLREDYLREKAIMFNPRRTALQEDYGSREAPADDHGTSHYSVVDGNGNAVACSETINLNFGSRLVVDGFGFCLNNEMDDFLTRRGTVNAFGLQQSERNLPEPGKRPLSSMSPTIILNRGEVEVVAGGSGGPRIISSTLQAILNVLLFDMSAEEAVEAPRFHHQWSPDKLYLERGLRGQDVAQGLFGKGHTPKPREQIGVVQLIRKKADGYQAASDPRKGGVPHGLDPAPSD